MKKFFNNHKILIIILVSVIVSIFVIISAITSISFKRELPDEFIDKLSTCSTPTGEIVARGLDISSYQETVDFERVKSQGYSFVILRVGTGQGKDRLFEENYKNAKNAGLDIGCYFYSYAKTPEEAHSEAKTALKYIGNKVFTYPVFYDFEYEAVLSTDRIQENTEMINSFCTEIKRNGYYPGVYTSSYIHNECIDKNVIDSKWDVWIANYGEYTGDVNYKLYSSLFSMWQFTDRGSVEGVSTNVDINTCFVNYPEIVGEFNDYFDRD